MCRSRQLTAYFGETDGEDCGECDVCRSKNRNTMSAEKFDKAFDEIFAVLSSTPLTIEDLVDRLGLFDAELIKDIIKKMIADEIAEVQETRIIRILE